eukprot:04856.XXX_125862_125981_1 [CDS] Oithona nana genome sequencing.
MNPTRFFFHDLLNVGLVNSLFIKANIQAIISLNLYYLGN